LDRKEEQLNRGGGLVCVENPQSSNIWNLLRNSVSVYEASPEEYDKASNLHKQNSGKSIIQNFVKL